MSSFGNKRAWEAPVATTLSIRSTANLTGPGGDTFLKQDNFGRPGVAPSIPLADVGALPIPSRSETIKTSDVDQRTWEVPVITTLTI